jgi:hypothetical protein
MFDFFFYSFVDFLKLRILRRKNIRIMFGWFRKDVCEGEYI